MKNKRLVWFGNRGGRFASGGMRDLALIRTQLELAHQKTPISLTIISNSQEMYRSLTKDWVVPTFYLTWNRYFISKILRLHSVSIIPITKNSFTMSKTDNRITTSLIHGLNVVADEIPSYTPYTHLIVLNDWLDGIDKLVNQDQVDKVNLDDEYFNSLNSKVIENWIDALQLC